jgi:hypothetical protein
MPQQSLTATNSQLDRGSKMTYPTRKDKWTNLAFAIAYIVVGAVLFYLNLTGTISSATFGLGIFGLIAASLILKFFIDFSRRRKSASF